MDRNAPASHGLPDEMGCALVSLNEERQSLVPQSGEGVVTLTSRLDPARGPKVLPGPGRSIPHLGERTAQVKKQPRQLEPNIQRNVRSQSGAYANGRPEQHPDR